MNQNKIGLAWIKEQFILDDIKIDTECFSAKISSINKEDVQCHLYPESYRPKDTVVDHLKFALKYESLNLRCLSDLFKKPDVDKEIEKALILSPNSKYNGYVTVKCGIIYTKGV